jgi:lysophospholipase L1-like esterase
MGIRMRKAMRSLVFRLCALWVLAGLSGCATSIDNVFMGDSITAFWWVPGKNLGVPGNTTVEMRARFPAEVLGQGYRVFVLLGGTNDIRYKVPTETALANIAAMAAAARKGGMYVVLCQIPPIYEDSFRHDPDVRQLNGYIQQLAESEHYYLVDYYDPMVGHRNYFWQDGIHPDVLGYNVMGQALAPVLRSVPAN